MLTEVKTLPPARRYRSRSTWASRMGTSPTPDQRAAYAAWLLADDEAIQARDTVLQAAQSGRANFDSNELDRLCARAKELRQIADRALNLALTALHRPSEQLVDAELADWCAGEGRDSKFVDLLRTIVEMEVHEIREHLRDAGRAPIDAEPCRSRTTQP